MRINNVSSLWNLSRLRDVNRSLQKVMNQLSTGKRIPAAGYDAAGIAIANKLRAQIEGFSKALDSIAYGQNLLNTAEGGISSIQDNLQRMRELAVQAANGTLTDSERTALQEEFNQLRQQIRQTAQSTQYNTINVLQGYNGEIQTGANEGQSMEVNIPNMNPENLTANLNGTSVNLNDINISTQQGAQQAIEAIDQMINQTSGVRSSIGAYTNRLEHAMNNVANAITNMTSALSTIEDMDMAKGIMEQVRLQLLSNVTTSIMAQSRVNSANVLNLLR
ncbi:MAG: flagellin [Thermotogaceae bacterium]|nr:flagellin [Thermotogaceae bacterium]